MFLHVLSDCGQVQFDRDIILLQDGLAANAREFEQLGSLDSA